MKILLADSDSESRGQISRILTAAGHVAVVTEGGFRAWDYLLTEDQPDVVMLDAALSDMRAEEICRAVRERSDVHRPYLVLLADSDAADDAFCCGADDIIANALDARILNARLRLAARVLDLQSKCASVSNPEADRDPLTGIWSRFAMMDFLHAHFSRSTRDGVSMAVILGDMDHFQSVNVSFGGAVCDSVLKESARRMKDSLRPYDCFGRFGGEEFIVIAPDCTMSNAQSIANRLRAVIGDQPFYVGGRKVEVTMSLGVATTGDTGALDEDGLLRSADSALLSAKENGRNRVELAKRIARTRLPQARFSPASKPRELIQ